MCICNKKKWLISCSYSSTKIQISNRLAEMSRSTDLYLTKYDYLLLLDDFIVRFLDSSVHNYLWKIHNFCSSYNVTSCLILTNCLISLQNSCAIETVLSDFHKLVVTVMKTTYKNYNRNKNSYLLQLQIFQ